ncbi:MAG: apolipoprotein N-acyltransferase, partial [Actinomycetota bacterium]|nr:apolipoprotein N-acyltransferase [Actinomycetota bacterium]
DLDGRPDLLAQLEATAADVGADLLVGTDSRREDRNGIIKSAVLVTPTGPDGRYDKLRLVPFGEYVPLRPLLGWLARFTPVADEDRRRGPGPRLLETAGVKIGPLICFESAFPDMSRHLARSGADLLVVQSSTSTFQDSAAPEQHAALAGVRARETGLPVVHATLTGASAVYAPDGQLLGQLGTDRRGTLVVDVPLTRGSTPYAAVGDVVPRAAVLFLLVWVAVTVTGMLARTSPAASSRS